MTWIVGLPFVALFLAIAVVRLMRSLRDVREAQARRMPIMFDADKRKPADDYHDHTWLPLCTRIAAAASSRLDRPLTAKERRVLWRARSVLVLEVASKEIQTAANPDAVVALLAGLPTGLDRPDPTGWCGGET